MRPCFRACLFCVFLACSREEKRPERTEPWPAPCVTASGSAPNAVRRASYELEKSELRFALPTRSATPRGRFPAAAGRFEIDFDNPAGSSGSVRVDLSRLEVEGSEENERADRTRRALDWLELGTDVAPSTRETNRYATLSFTRAEGAALGRQRRESKAVALDWTAFGELSLHGVRAPVSVAVRLELEPVPNGAPARLVIRSRKPLVVPLSVHDIRPRDARGVLVARELELLGKSVGREAEVDFELTLALGP